MRLCPFLAWNSHSDPESCHPIRYRMLLGLGISYGAKGTEEPDGRIGLWFWTTRRLWSRSRLADGSLRDNFKLNYCEVEIELGSHRLRFQVYPDRRPCIAWEDALAC